MMKAIRTTPVSATMNFFPTDERKKEERAVTGLAASTLWPLLAESRSHVFCVKPSPAARRFGVRQLCGKESPSKPGRRASDDGPGERGRKSLHRCAFDRLTRPRRYHPARR